MKNTIKTLGLAILMATAPLSLVLAHSYEPDTSSNVPEKVAFVTVNNAYEVGDIDKANTDMQLLKSKQAELNELLMGMGSVHMGKKGLIISFNEGEVLGLNADYKVQKNSAEYKKLVKALDAFDYGTVIIAGKTVGVTSKNRAHERAVDVAEVVSQKRDLEGRILVDPIGVSFTSEKYIPKTKNTVDFLLIPPRI
ncbi:hypothetical protein [Arcticibacterium luteifluviistationis]|uniref:OmpA-like domain-containing protein n=1 Tax=Arcticibacterium luteifluviistationis TaxID=1784714 RepID=A0A2Z4GGK7_9BACT|nr:hypothetical protein [Arcticibacterium luteifluviistationis]AWW00411.1 hypothetical protein DJ013_20415 [Arcticibacterium luteifluviistationis]